MPKKETPFRVVILGGGAGGICVAARLRRHFPKGAIAIVEPSPDHFYQPLWTLVGAGLVKKEKTRRPMAKLIPRGVTWIPDAVRKVNPYERTVLLEHGRLLGYDALVVATGLKLDFDKIEGLAGNLGVHGIHSIYDFQGAEDTAQALKSFNGGKALFVMPPLPIKCAGAPQKIVYMADDLFRRTGVRWRTEITFAVAGKVIFGIPEFAKVLTQVAHRKGVNVKYGHRLVAVNAARKEAVFEVATETGTARVVEKYDFLHVVPSMSAHSYVSESGLAHVEGPHQGWLEVDKHRLQHPVHSEVFGIGDVTGIPNSKTGAAVRKQAPVVADRVLAKLQGWTSAASYDGYSSCPLTTQKGRVILAEFGYDGKLLPSFPLDPTRERWTMWILKRYLLSRLYWHGMIPGWL